MGRRIRCLRLQFCELLSILALSTTRSLLGDLHRLSDRHLILVSDSFGSLFGELFLCYLLLVQSVPDSRGDLLRRFVQSPIFRLFLMADSPF